MSFTNVDEYLSQFSGDILEKLSSFRALIKGFAPDSQEVISYNMPAYKQNGILVYFAGNKNHIGFYPTASPIIAFADELKQYKTSKGAIQFPYSEPINEDLVLRIIQFKIEENNKKKK